MSQVEVLCPRLKFESPFPINSDQKTEPKIIESNNGQLCQKKPKQRKLQLKLKNNFNQRNGA